MNVLPILTGCDEGPKRIDAYPFRKTDFAWRHLSVCATLAIGEAIGFAGAPVCAYWPLASFLFVLWVLVGYGWKIPEWHYPAIFLVGLSLALFSESRRARVFDRCDYTSSPFTGDFVVEGRVRESERYLSFDSRMDGVDLRVMMRKSQALCVTNDLPSGVSATAGEVLSVPVVGELWHCSGWLEREDRDKRQRRTLWVGRRGCSAARVAEAPPASLRTRLRMLRERLAENIGLGLSHDPLSADLDRAMILGMRADMPSATRQMFADAGTVHVFAISGLHVGVIAWLIVYLLMAVCCFPLRWVALPLAPILAAYVVMIDAPPSAVRAAVMSVVYFSAPMFFHRSDSLVAWSITFLAFHVLNPSVLMNVGSILSFTVMLGILLYVRWAEVFKRELLVTFGVTVAAWLSGVAIAARVFERITVGGLCANVFVIPLATLAVVVGLAGAVMGFVCPWLAAHLNNAAALLIRAMTGISWVTSSIPNANLVVTPWPLWMCFAWYLAIVMLFWLIRSVYLHHRELF